MEIDQIIEAVLSGDEQAQRYLYEKYKRALFIICLRYAEDRDQAEDMLQEGFIQIFKDLKQFRGAGAFEAWTRRVMVNSALRYLRKWKKNIQFVEPEHAAHLKSTTPSIDDMLSAKELISLIQRLPEGYRTVFNLFVIEGYSHREIAKILEITESTSKTQLFKAKAALRLMVKKQLLI